MTSLFILSRTTVLFFLLIAFSGFSQKATWGKIKYAKTDVRKLDSLDKRTKLVSDSIIAAEIAKDKSVNLDSLKNAISMNTEVSALISVGENGKWSSPGPAICYAFKKNDTTYVKVFFGFMSGCALNFKIAADNFTSSYFEFADNEKIYAKKQDSPFKTKEIEVNNEKQKLTLNSKTAEVISGDIETTSVVFYQLGQNKTLAPKTVSVKAKFRCKPGK